MAIDDTGSPARPMTSEAPWDGQRREFRDLRRRWTEQVPNDHPTWSDLVEARQRRKEALRARVASARDAARARREQGL